MDYIAVAVEDGTLQLPSTAEDWWVVSSPSPLWAVQLALAHGAIPVLGGGEPLDAIHRATRLDLAQPHALPRIDLELGDSVFLLTRGWRELNDGAVEFAAWQDGEPTVVLRLAVVAVSDHTGVRLIPDRVDILPRCATGPLDEPAILKWDAAYPGLSDCNNVFAEVQRRGVGALRVEQAFLLAATEAQTQANVETACAEYRYLIEQLWGREGLVPPRPQGLLAMGDRRYADHQVFDEAASLDPQALEAYLTELADLPPLATPLTNRVPRTAAPSTPADAWKYAVAATEDRRWPDPTDPLRPQPPPAPPSAVQLVDWEVGEASGEGRATIGFCPSPDPQVREHAVALLDGSDQIRYSEFLPLPAHQITLHNLRWDEPYQVVVNSIDTAGRWSIAALTCLFTFHSPSAAAVLLPTAEPSAEHIYMGQEEERLLVATATFAEPVPAPVPVPAGWWCADCQGFVLLAAERVGGLCLECGGRETTWREG